MLNSQKVFAQYLKTLQELLSGHEFVYDQSLLQRVVETEMVVPVIGAFSAGKSTLLNQFIGRSVLPEGIAPETELATELRYSEEDYVLAIRPDGSQERFPAEELSTINRRSSEFSHLRLYLNSEALKAIAPLVLVDMPGFGSSLENHNQAISFYLPRGVHFLVVTSIEDGTITQSMLRKLEEIKTYNAGFSFFLSKANLRGDDQITEVKTLIEDMLDVHFDTTLPVLPVGRDAKEKLTDALQGLNPDQLFHNLFIDILKDVNFEILDQINLALSMLKKDKSEIKNTLVALEEALSSLQRQRMQAEDSVHDIHTDRIVKQCLKNLDRDLTDALEDIAGVACGKDAEVVNNVITDIVRGSITSTIKSEMSEVSSSLVAQIAGGITSSGNELQALNLDEGWSEALTAKVQLSLERGTQILDSWNDRLTKRKQEDKDNDKVVYKTITTVLAVATAVINPLVELMLIFLPELVKFIQGGKEQDRVKATLTEKVFPSIKANLRSKLPDIINEQVDALLASIADKFEEQINNQKEVVSSVSAQINERQSEIADSINTLTALADSVKRTATEFLYR